MPFGGASDRAARPECRHLQPAGASFYAEGEWTEADEAYGEAATALQVNDLQVALRRPALDLIIACWLNQAQCQLQLRAWAKAEKLCDGVVRPKKDDGTESWDETRDICVHRLVVAAGHIAI